MRTRWPLPVEGSSGRRCGADAVRRNVDHARQGDDDATATVGYPRSPCCRHADQFARAADRSPPRLAAGRTAASKERRELRMRGRHAAQARAGGGAQGRGSEPARRTGTACAARRGCASCRTRSSARSTISPSAPLPGRQPVRRRSAWPSWRPAATGAARWRPAPTSICCSCCPTSRPRGARAIVE